MSHNNISSTEQKVIELESKELILKDINSNRFKRIEALEARNKILLISNNSIDISFFCSVLSKVGHVVTLNSVKQSVAMCEAQLPDVILVDNTLINEGGSEFTSLLQNCFEKFSIPTFIISERNYSFGKDADSRFGNKIATFDYLYRPLQQNEVLSRINRSLKTKALIDNALEEAQESSSVAFDALKASSEMGILIRSLDKIYQSKTIKEFAFHSLELLLQLNLEAIIQVREGENKLNFSLKNKEISDVEEAILGHYTDGKAIAESGRLIVLFTPKVSILVTNMPDNSPEIYGRFKDHLAILSRACESAVSNIMKNQAVMIQKGDSVTQTLSSTSKAVETFAQSYDSFRQGTMNLVEDMIQDLEDILYSVCESKEQEASIMKVFESSKDKIFSLADSGSNTSYLLESLKLDFRSVQEHLKF